MKLEPYMAREEPRFNLTALFSNGRVLKGDVDKGMALCQGSDKGRPGVPMTGRTDLRFLRSQFTSTRHTLIDSYVRPTVEP